MVICENSIICKDEFCMHRTEHLESQCEYMQYKNHPRIPQFDSCPKCIPIFEYQMKKAINDYRRI